MLTKITLWEDRSQNNASSRYKRTGLNAQENAESLVNATFQSQSILRSIPSPDLPSMVFQISFVVSSPSMATPSS